MKSQEDVLAWLKMIGVRYEYDALRGKYSFPANDLYELLKGLQALRAEQRAEDVRLLLGCERYPGFGPSLSRWLEQCPLQP